MDICCIDNGFPLSLSRLNAWQRLLEQHKILFLFGIPGLSKTTHVRALADLMEKPETVYVSAVDEAWMERADACLAETGDADSQRLLILDDLVFYSDLHAEQWIEDRLFRTDVPNQLAVILLSSMRLPSNLTRYVLTKQLVSIDGRSLYLDEPAVMHMLRQEPWGHRAHENLIRSRAHECVMLTRGYPIAVRSYIRHMTDDDPPRKMLDKRISKDVSDVLLNASICSSGDHMKETLAALSVFTWFSYDMAVQLIGDPAGTRVQPLLDRAAVFIEIAVGYMFMPYLQNVLQQNLLARVDLAEARALFNRAGSLYEAADDPVEALRCYLQAGNEAKVRVCSLRLIESVHYPTLRRFIEDGLFDRMDFSAEEEQRQMAAKAILALVELKATEAAACLDELRMLSEAELADRADDLLELPYTQAYVRTLLAPPHISMDRLRSFVLVINRLYNLSGELPSPNVLAGEANAFNLLSVLAGATMDDRQAIESLQGLLGNEMVSRLKLILAKYSFESGRRSNAVTYIANALNNPGHKVMLRQRAAGESELMRMFVASGEVDKARYIIDSLQTDAERLNNEVVGSAMAAAKAWIDLLVGNLSAVRIWLDLEERDPLEPVLLQDYYRLSVQAMAYLAFGDHVRALQRLALIESFAEATMRSFMYIEINILKALALYRMEADWQHALKKSIEAAATHGFNRAFVFQGAALLPLWLDIAHENAVEKTFYLDVMKGLKAMAVRYPNYLRKDAVTDNTTEFELSRREMEVLELIQAGKKNAEISDILFITMATVKFHIANIMKKLGASNRTDAVRRAIEEGVL